MIPWLEDESLIFPCVNTALQEPDGLLAASESITWKQLIHAYCQGIFPWYNEPDPVLWWSPNPRAVLFPDELHISSSLKKLIRKKPFTVTYDHCFSQVMRACAEPRNYTDSTWISDTIINAYSALHERGIAHSVEVWDKDKLVGGLYGIALGKVFFGESMFSRSPNASKIGFVHLVHQLKEWRFQVIDCQVASDHMMSLGASLISRDQFQALLKCLINQPQLFNDVQAMDSGKTPDITAKWSSIKTTLPL